MKTLLLNAEDDQRDTIVPRLLAAGANLRYVEFSNEVTDGRRRRIDLTKDADRLREWIEKYSARLVVIDPLSAFLGSEVETYKESSVREALTPLVELAHSAEVAIVGIRHWSKSANRNATHRGLGSIGFSAVTRSLVQFGRHPTEEGQFVVALGKANLANEKASISYRIESRAVESQGTVIESSGIVWNALSDVTAVDLSGEAMSADERFMQSEIAKFILTELQERGGSAKAGDMNKEGLRLGFSSSAMCRARKKLGIVSRKVGSPKTGGSMWVWETTDSLPPAEPPRNHKVPQSSNVGSFENR